MKYLLFKNLEVFSIGGFSLTEDVLYLVTLETDDILFSADNNQRSIGISIYADPLVVEIVNELNEVVNEAFVEVVSEELEYQ